MDGGYRGEDFMHWVMDMFRTDCGNRPQTVGKQRFRSITKALGRGENIWLAQLVSALESTDYERLPQTSETFIYIAMIRIMIRRLA